MSEEGLQKYKLWRARISDAWGFKITTVDKKTFITAIYNDTPAEKAGVALNDIIVSIDKVPCYNVSHEYVYHVIRNTDHNMTLVTRKATQEDLQAVGDLTKELTIKGPYEKNIDDVVISSSKGSNETKRRSKSTGGNQELRHKDEENGKESSYPDSKRKNRISSTTDANDSHSNKHRSHNSVGKREGREDPISNKHEEKRKISSKTLSPNVQKEVIRKESKSHKRLTRTLENNLVNDIEEDRMHKVEGVNHREDKNEKNRESRVVNREDNSRITMRETITKRKESATMKSEIRTGKTPQLIKSKSTVGFDTTEPDAEAVSEMKRSFPSMVEIRANLQAGKRRTLLLSRGDSFEDRVDLLNNL